MAVQSMWNLSHSANRNVKHYNHLGKQFLLQLNRHCISKQQFVCPKEMKTYVYPTTHAGMFIAVLFMMVKN